jgi:hypothetical protein
MMLKSKTPFSPPVRVSNTERPRPDRRVVEVSWDNVTIIGYPGEEATRILEALRNFPITVCAVTSQHGHLPGGVCIFDDQDAS